MKSLLLTLLFAVISSASIFAQEVEIECTLNVEEILMAQPWEMDDPRAELAREIVDKLIVELKTTYLYDPSSDAEAIGIHIDAIDELIVAAVDHGMNLDMFAQDFERIDSLR